MCDRVPNLDLRFFVTSVAIQRQTGGDLAEILDRIGHVIRERFKILGQVKALTAEGRLSGVVLIALPIGLFLMMLWMKPDYIELLWKDPLGVKMSIAAIVLMLIGSLRDQEDRGHQGVKSFKFQSSKLDPTGSRHRLYTWNLERGMSNWTLRPGTRRLVRLNDSASV